MKINNVLSEKVLYDDKLKSILYSLKTKLLNDNISEKIKTEINFNWQKTNEIRSITLVTIIENVISKYIDNISITVNNHISEFGYFKDLDNSYELGLNILALAKESGVLKSLKLKDKISYIDDFLIQCIDAVLHEMVHYLQSKTRPKLVKVYSKNDYFNDKDELMSFAAEITSNLKSQGYTKKQAMDIIQKGEDEEGFKSSKILNLYKKMPKVKNWKTFMKYIYGYLEKWDDL